MNKLAAFIKDYPYWDTEGIKLNPHQKKVLKENNISVLRWTQIRTTLTDKDISLYEAEKVKAILEN